MKYYSAIDLPPRIPSPKGSRMQPVYSLTENKETGERLVCRTGEHDLFADVQESRASCDIRELIKRFEAGDEDALDQRKGVYADLTDLSGLTLNEVYSLIGDLRTRFEAAPLDLRKEFDNNFDVFVRRGGYIPQPEVQPEAQTEPVDEKEKM